MTTRILSAVIVIVTMLASTVAGAQPAADRNREARQHYTHGKQLVDSNDFAAAYVEFAAGYELSPRAQFLFNMAECERSNT